MNSLNEPMVENTSWVGCRWVVEGGRSTMNAPCTPSACIAFRIFALRLTQ
jgi:hypothetical protein